MVDVHSQGCLNKAENDAEKTTVRTLEEDKALLAMKEMLPQYVVDSFIATGFDTLKVISEIDTTTDNDLVEI